MIDWSKSMTQRFEYYRVNPNTWRDTARLTNVIKASIRRSSTTDTLQSAAFTTDEYLGECYIRVYMIAQQGIEVEKIPLGTFLAQSQNESYDGVHWTMSADAYSPLIELKENAPSIGYYSAKGSNILDAAYALTKEHLRAPVVKTVADDILPKDFVATDSDTWFTYIRDLLGNAQYTFDIDEMGRILFRKSQKFESMRSVWTFRNDDRSIILPSVSTDKDIYGIPNTVEVIYSDTTAFYHVMAVNDDENSPVSTVNRGRTITKRITSPNISGLPNQEVVSDYAKKQLESLSKIEYKVTFTHGYCPIRIGDCITIDYPQAGLSNVRMLVVSQDITCDTGCEMSSTAVFTKKLWG